MSKLPLIVSYRYLARLTPSRPAFALPSHGNSFSRRAGLTTGDMAQKRTERVSYEHTRSIFNLQFCHNNRASWKRAWRGATSMLHRGSRRATRPESLKTAWAASALLERAR